MEYKDQTENIAALWAALREQKAYQKQGEARARAQEAEIAHLKAELQRQRLEKVELAGRLAEVEGGHSEGEIGLSRARLLKAAAAGIAGIAGAGALGLDSAGTALAASSDTTFTATGVGGSGGGNGFYAPFSANFDNGVFANGTNYGVIGSSSSGSGVSGQSTAFYGVVGTSDQNRGVFGQSNSGIGVEGDSNNNIGGRFYGGLAQLMLYPHSSAGAPTTGTHSAGEVYVDSNAVFYICTTAGTPGSWKQLASTSDTNYTATGIGGGGTGFSAPSSANFYRGVEAFGSVDGMIGLSESGIGVYGRSPGGTGVSGYSEAGNGVSGQSHSDSGVYGLSSTAPGVLGRAVTSYGVEGTSSNSIGGWFQGGLAPLFLQPNSSSDAPTAGTHTAGEIYVDSNIVFYICTASGTPGTWKQLATTDLGFQPFANPRRIFGSTMTSGQVSGAASVTTAGVPAGARSAYCAVQATPTTAGPLTLFPAGTTDPGIANWTAIVPNVLNLSYMLVPLNSAGQFQIHSYLNGPVYVDVWGYLV